MKFINIETEESQESTQQTINYSRSDYINIDLPYDDLYLMDTVATDSFDNEPKKIELINPINIQGLDKCYQSLQYFTIDNLFSELQTSVLKELARKNLGIDLNTISVKGDIKLGIINLSQLDNVKQAQSELTETNQIAYFIITDNSGKLPSKQTAYSVPTNVVRQLLFASPNPTTLTLLNIVASKVSFSSIGVNVGDLIALTRIKVKVSDLANVVDITISEASEIELYLYKILATNDAKPYNYNGITQGVMGLMSPWDKTEVNKIRGIENVANAALPRIDYLPSKWENNMNNCLETGVYPWCTLGRPEGSTGAYTCISIKSSTNDGNYYTIEQTAYGRLNELGLIYKRIIFYKKDGTDTLYHDWINISDSFKTNYYTKDESVELFAKKTSVEANNEKISKILSGETPVEKADKLTNKRTISLSGYAVSNTPSFDGSSNVTLSVNSINDRGLLLGLSAKEGDYYRAKMTPIDTANLEFSTNRLAFNNPECITIEYSNDGGNTWLDYEATDKLKIGFISGMEIPFFLGKNITALTANQDMLRIKINHNRGAYTNMQRLYIYLSTHGAMVDNSHALLCKVEKSLCKDPENLSLVGNYLVTGWSGWNSINIDGYFGTVSDTNIHTIQLTFSFNNLSSAYISKTKAKIMKLQMLGNTVFNNSTGCKLLQTGHIYDYDLYKNVIFPAKLTSTILESNIETGTAPIKVKSTTKVSNLKSEYSEKDVNGNIIHTTYATKLEVENEINRAEKIVRKEDIVNNLTDGGADKALSAEMGKELDWKAEKVLNDTTMYSATTNTEYISVSIAGTGYLTVNTTGTPKQSSSAWYSEFIPVSSEKVYWVLTVKSKYDASVGFYAEANFESFISATLNDAQDRLVDEFVSVPAGANYMVVCTRSQNVLNVASVDKTKAASKHVERALEVIQQQIDNGAINKLLGLTDNVFNPYHSDSIQEIQLYCKGDNTLTTSSKGEIPFCYFIKIGRKCKPGKYYNFKIFSESDLGVAQLFLCVSDKLQDGEKVIKGSGSLADKRGYFLADVESELYLYVKFISSAENIPFRLERLNEIVNSLVVTETDSLAYPKSYIPHRGIAFSLMREDVSGDTINLYIVDSNNVQIGNKVELKIGNSNTSADILDSKYLNSVQSITYKLAENTVSDAVVVGEGWSGNALTGYSHTPGNTEALEFSLNNYVIGTKLIVRFKSLGITGESSDVLISVGDAPSVKTYNGSNSFVIGVVVNGGNLKITPQSDFASVITDISIQEVDEEGEDEITLKVTNVYAQQNAMITAFWNVAIGAKDNTLNQLVNGSRNVAIGNYSLKSISSGNRNVGIGTFAMPFLTEAENNVAIGADTIYPLKQAFNCVGIGKATLGGSQKAENCVAVGAGAMGSYSLAKDRTNCVVIGVKSAPNVTENCTHVGYRAGANVAGGRNTSIGYNSLAIGNRSTADITGTDLTCVGSMSQIANTDIAKAATNSTAIGANTTITKSNQIVIGDSQIEEVIIGGKKIIFNADGSCSWEPLLGLR